jgi:hypothetical protein
MSEVMPPPARNVAVREEPTSLINIIARAMHDDTFDVNKLESLIRIQREIVQEQAQQEFNRAMSVAQSEMRAIRRDGKNDQTHSRYARLETIDDEIRPIYTQHGFSLTFSTEPAVDPINIRVVCEIAHSGGHVKKLGLESPPDVMGAKGLVNKTALHGLGSTVSYLRRYLTCMIFNVVLYNEDDDGNRGGLRQTAYEEENARRAAAMATQRPPRKAEPATNGNGSAHWTDAQWSAWLEKVNAGVRVVRHAAEVDEIAKRPTVADKYADITTPPWVIRELDAILAEGHARFVKPQDGGVIDNAPENDPDGGPRIAGEAYVGAG